MYAGKLVFAQVMEHLPLHAFRRIVSRYAGERKVKSFSCLDQFLCMAFAQLTYRESLRDMEACLRAQQPERDSGKPLVTRPRISATAGNLLTKLGNLSQLTEPALCLARRRCPTKIFAGFEKYSPLLNMKPPTCLE
jgi:hypothetical protein